MRLRFMLYNNTFLESQMRKRIEWQWEKLDDCTMRARVIGGWLISTAPFTPSGSKAYPSHSAIFIPDPNHEWSILKPISEQPQNKSNVASDFEAPKA